MASVGLLYVGAVLFVNGLMLLDLVSGKAAAVLNVLVGVMQVVFPTVIIMQSDGDANVIFGAAGLYLFGFTYLYVAANQIWGLSGDGLGWFSLFVAVCAVVIGAFQFMEPINDPLFGVIWFTWALLWLLFFVLLALGRTSITRATGWFTIIVAHLTATIPAFLLLTGHYDPSWAHAAIWAVAAVVALVLSFMLGRRPAGHHQQNNPATA